MKPRSIAIRLNKAKFLLAAFLTTTAIASGCWDSAIAIRFREAYVPGLTAGLSSAITDPTNAESGLREAGAALVEGLGAALQPRSATSGSSSGSSSGA